MGCLTDALILAFTQPLTVFVRAVLGCAASYPAEVLTALSEPILLSFVGPLDLGLRALAAWHLMTCITILVTWINMAASTFSAATDIITEPNRCVVRV